MYRSSDDSSSSSIVPLYEERPDCDVCPESRGLALDCCMECGKNFEDVSSDDDLPLYQSVKMVEMDNISRSRANTARSRAGTQFSTLGDDLPVFQRMDDTFDLRQSTRNAEDRRKKHGKAPLSEGDLGVFDIITFYTTCVILKEYIPEADAGKFAMVNHSFNELLYTPEIFPFMQEEKIRYHARQKMLKEQRRQARIDRSKEVASKTRKYIAFACLIAVMGIPGLFFLPAPLVFSAQLANWETKDAWDAPGCFVTRDIYGNVDVRFLDTTVGDKPVSVLAGNWADGSDEDADLPLMVPCWRVTGVPVTYGATLQTEVRNYPRAVEKALKQGSFWVTLEWTVGFLLMGVFALLCLYPCTSGEGAEGLCASYWGCFPIVTAFLLCLTMVTFGITCVSLGTGKDGTEEGFTDWVKGNFQAGGPLTTQGARKTTYNADVWHYEGFDGVPGSHKLACGEGEFAGGVAMLVVGLLLMVCSTTLCWFMMKNAVEGNL